MVQQVFVARERELEQLDGLLQRALAAQGAVCFVTGEAGSGKTALVTEFAQRAQEAQRDLVVAVGQSDAQTGIGDSYLPFREVLGQLTGDVEAKLAQGAITEENAGRLRKLLLLSAQALVEVGPDLVGVFVPGVGLATQLGAFVAEKAGWLEKLERLAGRPRAGQVSGTTAIEQGQIFEQYTNVLNRLAEKQPLLVVLDDLQWADAASISLLFRLGRRIGRSRILILGTYRPEEVALGRPSTSSGQVERHPLEKVLAEFKRYYGDVAVDLDATKEAEGRRFIDAFLDTESNRLGERFRWALYQHTDGHPLFTIELLRDMQERGDLVRDERGRWVEGPALDWDKLPVRVEGVIEERIGRLEADLREALTVGSVEGEDFTAEVVAGVRAADAGGLIRRLSGELAKQHRLVSGLGVRRVEGHRLSLYRFQHNLFQKYLYGELDEAEREYLHEDVGTVLEDLYGDRVDEIAVQLARHFVEAGVADKAVRYLRLAGEQAAARFANDEAVDYFSRALDLAPKDGTPEWVAERYALLLARERVYDLRGEREAQAQDLAAQDRLAEVLDDNLKRAEVVLRRAHYANVTGDYRAAAGAAEAAISMSQAVKDVRGQAIGHLAWGRALWRQGDYDAARAQLELALSLGRSVSMREIKAGSLRDLGVVSWYSGDYDAARAYAEKASQIFREIGDRRAESGTLGNLGILYARQGDHAKARTCFEEVLRISRQIGERQSEGNALNALGILTSNQGDYAEAEAYYQRSLRLRREIGDRQGEATSLLNLGDLYREQGGYTRARAYFEQSLHIEQEMGNRRGEAKSLINLSQVAHGCGDDGAACTCGEQALHIAQGLGDQSTKGYALTCLGHAYQGLGRLAEATDAYYQALCIRQELGEHHLAMESLAGLAHVALAQGDLDRAQAHVGQILGFLENNTLEGTEEPFRIYFVCHQVLRANQDPRAREILTSAYDLLHERAAKISDAELRRSFLEEVPAHREIMHEFAKGQ